GQSPLIRHLLAEGVPLPPQVLHHARSMLGVPLVARGKVIGNLGLVHETPGFYTERHAQLALGFAQQAAVAIENARLYGELRERPDAMVGLQRLGATLLQEHDFERVLEAICRQLQHLTEAEDVALVLLEEREPVFELRAAVGAYAARRGARFPVEGSFAG